MTFHFKFFPRRKIDMSFIYQNLRDRERTCIKEKVKSRSKYTCTEISYDPVEMTDREGTWQNTIPMTIQDMRRAKGAGYNVLQRVF